MERSPGWRPYPRPGGLSGLILMKGGSCGSDQTTFLRLPMTQRLILTMFFYVPPTSSLTGARGPTWRHLRIRSGAGRMGLRRLDVAAGDGKVADEAGDGDRHDHRDPAGAEAGAAQRMRPAEVVGERGAQGTGHDVGEPEGGDRIEPEPRPEHGGNQDDEDEHDRRREIAQAQDAGREVAQGSAEREGGEHHGPVVGLTPPRDDAVDRQRALAAVPEPENQREHHGPEQRGAGVRDAGEQVQGVGHPGAEDRDGISQRPVGGRDVAAAPDLPYQRDD